MPDKKLNILYLHINPYQLNVLICQRVKLSLFVSDLFFSKLHWLELTAFLYLTSSLIDFNVRALCSWKAFLACLSFIPQPKARTDVLTWLPNRCSSHWFFPLCCAMTHPHWAVSSKLPVLVTHISLGACIQLQEQLSKQWLSPKRHRQLDRVASTENDYSTADDLQWKFEWTGIVFLEEE